MIRRCKWYDAKLKGIKMSTIATMIAESPFSERKSKGFIVDEYRGGWIKARYIHKRRIESVIDTPFGEKLQQNYIDYEITNFCLIKDGAGLELYDPPRSTIDFFNQLGLVTDFKLSIEGFTVDVRKWLEFYKKKSSSEFKIISVECKEIQLDKFAKGTLCISSHDDADKYLDKFLQGRSTTIKNISILVGGNSFTLSTAAIISSTKGFTDFQLSEFRQSMPFSESVI